MPLTLPRQPPFRNAFYYYYSGVGEKKSLSKEVRVSGDEIVPPVSRVKEAQRHLDNRRRRREKRDL